MADKTEVGIPGLGMKVRLVERDSLRREGMSRNFTIPTILPLVGEPVPAPPSVIDWQGNNTYPMLGNDQYGDCYYTCVCHLAQTWTGANGHEADFNVGQVIRRYLQLSPDDSGLATDTIVREFKAGIVGPNGPHTILDELAIRPTDHQAMAVALYLFGGVCFTLGVPDRWLQTAQPGTVWDAGAGVSANPRNGHAVLLTGKRGAAGYDLQTWGFKPPVLLTPRGVEVCDPEAWVGFSLDWFDATGKAPNGFYYNQLAMWWQMLGGRALPPSPFPDPDPTPTPTPPPTPTPTPQPTHPILDVVLHAPLGFLGRDVILKGTATPRTSTGADRPDDSCWHGEGEGFSLTPEQWRAIIDAILKLLPVLFGVHVEEANLRARLERLTPAQWAALIQAIMQLLPILFGGH